MGDPRTLGDLEVVGHQSPCEEGPGRRVMAQRADPDAPSRGAGAILMWELPDHVAAEVP